jgi:predicted AlkP superfamily pyrophosphatase or phosphodiesterase
LKQTPRAWPGSVVALVLALALVSAAAQRAPSPILILVSFDGFRWDYLDRGETPNLKALAARGVRAEGLIPSFPAVTFPNHYTIVTGLYPEHHGIVANNMVDAGWPEKFTMSAKTALDQRWWGGEPIWVTARRQNLRSGAMFWPGSDVPIGGIYPNYWTAFDDNMPNVDRVNHALDQLALPEGERPSFLTVYFSEVDHAGHDYGPDSPEMAEALRHVDASLGLLETGINQLHLRDRTTLVVLSDHGMAPLGSARIIFLDDYLDLSRVVVEEWGEVVQLRPRTGSVDDISRAIKGKHPSMTVYTREEMPARFHYRDNPRIQPVLALAAEGWEITSHARWQADLERHRKRGGAHGYDPALMSMHGLFVAAGPGVKRGVVAPEFENVHVYDFLCGILGLSPAKNDGDPGITRAFLTR